MHSADGSAWHLQWQNICFSLVKEASGTQSCFLKVPYCSKNFSLLKKQRKYWPITVEQKIIKLKQESPNVTKFSEILKKTKFIPVIRPIKLNYDTKLQFLLYPMLPFVYAVLHARLVKYSTKSHLRKLRPGEWMDQKSPKLPPVQWIRGLFPKGNAARAWH
jgi:hypothetical protein